MHVLKAILATDFDYTFLFKHKSSGISSEAFAVWTGLEPVTPCVTGMYSNQLNYQTKFYFLKGELAVWTGLEPVTPCVTGMYSNQLNYQTNKLEIKTAVWTGLEPVTPCVTGMYSNQLNYQTVFITFKKIRTFI
jgi:hypothetical protein